jgi:hypothetical protein
MKTERVGVWRVRSQSMLGSVNVDYSRTDARILFSGGVELQTDSTVLMADEVEIRSSDPRKPLDIQLRGNVRMRTNLR